MKIEPAVIDSLKVALGSLRFSDAYKNIVEPRDAVFNRFQPIFSLAHLSQLSKDEFCLFLDHENNCHWSGLQRQGPKICADMSRLRFALGVLLDAGRPLAARLNEAMDGVSGFGKGTASAILLISFPNSCGVWNRTSEAAMRRFDLFPERVRGETKGQQYTKINEILLDVSKQLQIDLWTLDALWWHIETVMGKDGHLVDDAYQPISPPLIENGQRFALEKHLHEFMLENWDNIDLAKDWEIYSEPGDPDLGFKYRTTDAGEIDILAKHKQLPKWLVIELKRDQSSDQTVGQVLRYMGWVQICLANTGEEVEGLVVAAKADKTMQYALVNVPSVKLKTYEVSFQLQDIEKPNN